MSQPTCTSDEFSIADETEIIRAKLRIRALGFFFRYTEWTGGCQGGAFHRSWPAKYGDCGPWRATEVEAYRDALRIAEAFTAKLEAEAELRRNETT